MAQKVGRREIYPPVPPLPPLFKTRFTLEEIVSERIDSAAYTQVDQPEITASRFGCVSGDYESGILSENFESPSI